MTRRTFLDMLVGFAVTLFAFWRVREPEMTIMLLGHGFEYAFQPGDTAVIHGMDGRPDVRVVVTSRMGGDGTFVVRFA